MAKLIKCNDCGEEISKKAKTCPRCGAPNTPKPPAIVYIIVGIIVFCSLGYCMNQEDEPELKDQVKLSYSIKKNALGMTKGDFTITNNNQVVIKDISITCVNYSKTNARLNDIHTVIYEGVGKGVTRNFNNVDMGMSDKNTFKSVCVLGRVKPF